MGWRIVVVTGVAKLDYKMGYLELRTVEEQRRVLLEEISVLMVESTAVSLTAYLLWQLVESGVNVVFCNPQHLPCAQLLPCAGSHDTAAKYRAQIAWPTPLCRQVWAHIVQAKIQGQAAVLQGVGHPAAAQVAGYAAGVQPGDTTNREGHAAKVYFNALFGPGFTRSSGCHINAALNYGYSILLSVFAREAVANGYATQLGLFHHSVNNPYNLACDLMEPYRPLVDRLVYGLPNAPLTRDTRRAIARVLACQVQLQGKNYYLTDAAAITAKSVFNALQTGNCGLLRFPQGWG